MVAIKSCHNSNQANTGKEAAWGEVNEKRWSTGYLPLRGKFFGILLFPLLEYQFSIFLTCKLFVPQQTTNC